MGKVNWNSTKIGSQIRNYKIMSVNAILDDDVILVTNPDFIQNIKKELYCIGIRGKILDVSTYLCFDVDIEDAIC